MQSQLDTILQSIVESFELAGLAVGIVQGDELAYAQGFGVHNIETGTPITPNSVFYTASISKTFVATAIMQLVEMGSVDLDEPVITYLTYFTLNDESVSNITIRHMLSHISGMPDVEDYYWDQPTDDVDALENYVRSLHEHTLLSTPGEAFAYSNMAYEVLGDVIAKVTGQPFETTINEIIFKPLGMSNSTFLRPTQMTSPHVRIPHLAVSPVYPYNRTHTPSSTCHASLMDLSRWVRMFLNGGIFLDGQRILRDASVETMWQQQFEIDEDEYMGLGWFVEPYADDTKRFVYHEGGDIGFLTNIAILPEESLAVIILSNSALTPIWEIMDIALTAARGHEIPNDSIPLPPALLPLSHTVMTLGQEAALAQAQTLQQTHPDDYTFDTDLFYFPAFHASKILRQPQIALDILRLCKALYPNSDQVQAYLAELEDWHVR
ncbi:MAG: serine hydrolase domain-containing protein [Chloroflexota bacterium]